MRSAAPRAAEDHEISRFPYAVLPCVRGVSDRAGPQRASRWRHAEYGLPLLPTASAPRSSHEFRGSIAAEHSEYVLALDADHLAVDRMYARYGSPGRSLSFFF